MSSRGGRDRCARRDARRASTRFKFPFAEAHNLDNALAAIAAGVALGVPLAEMADRAPRDSLLAPPRRARRARRTDAVLINDCYNANPISMRAALDHLASLDGGRAGSRCSARWRELGPDAAGLPPRDRRRTRASVGVELI